MTRQQSPARIMVVALGLGLCADLLFYSKSLGANVIIFVALVVVALFLNGGIERIGLAWRNLWLLLPLFFFASMIFIRANLLLTGLNLVAVFGLLGLYLYFFATDHLDSLSLLGYPYVILLAFNRVLIRPGPIVVQGAKGVAAQRQRFRLAVPLLRGLFIALPILAVFTLLLASADTVFAGYMTNLFQLRYFNYSDFLMQLTIVLMATWLCSGGLLYALGRYYYPVEDRELVGYVGTIVPKRVVGFVESSTVLVLVNLLFAFFAWVQFNFLFSGPAGSHMDYQTYRNYVHQGFGELLVAAFLTLCLILGLRHLSRNDHPGQELMLKLLSTLMIGLAMVMLVSAFQRMLVWENVEFYINTATRLYVRAFIVWLGFLFGWLFFTMWTRPERFAIGGFVAALGFLVTINLMNPDADVAAYNLAKYQVSQDELSTRYLYTLSDDAIPVLVAGLDQTGGDNRTKIVRYLSDRYSNMNYDKGWQDWPAFHLARWQAYDLLKAAKAAGKI
jgi:hypothetical protein